MSEHRYIETYDDGATFELRIRANFANAADPIEGAFDCWGGGDFHYESTPYQVADACHSPDRAARLISDYFNDADGGEYAVSVEESA